MIKRRLERIVAGTLQRSGKPRQKDGRTIDLEAMLPELAAKLKKRDVTGQTVYAHYIRACPAGYKHSAFLARLNAYTGMSKVSMRVLLIADSWRLIAFFCEINV